MPERTLLALFCAATLFAATGALAAQQPADPSAPSGGTADPTANQKTNTKTPAPATDAPTASNVCTVHPDSVAAPGGAQKPAGGSANPTPNSSPNASGAPTVQVNQYASPQPQANAGVPPPAGQPAPAAKPAPQVKPAPPGQPPQSKQPTQSGQGSSKPALTEVWTLSTAPPPKGPKDPTLLQLPANTVNAAEIAPRLSVLSPRILEATPVGPSTIILVVNKSQAAANELSTLRAGLTRLAVTLAFSQPNANPATAARSALSPYVFSITLKAGTGKACDIAHALVNAFPYVTEITAVDDSRLLVSLSGSAPDLKSETDQKPAPDSTEAKLLKLAAELSNPITATAPKVETIVQRLYYNHDPKSVATIINDAYPNVAAQPLAPDSVVLTDPADLDDGAQRQALGSAQRTIARIDQPHPQVSVDAWSLQLATKSADDLGSLIPRLEDLANGYNEAIDKALVTGWEYLSSRLGGSSRCLDPLMEHYLTWTTRVSSSQETTGSENSSVPSTTVIRVPGPLSSKLVNAGRTAEQDTVDRVAEPYSSKLAQASTERGYGLGYSTLYYPLSPNLIDMLVTLVSLCDPRAAAQTLLSQMGTDESHESLVNPDHRNTCREEDEIAYNLEIAHDESERKKQKTGYSSLNYKGIKPTPAHPARLHLACVRSAIVDGLLGENDDKNKETVPATSALGQFRAALADFLFHYKIMVEYPDDFHAYTEPMAADALDSAFAPIVAAFDEDLSVFQANLQAQVANTIRDEKKNITYGYGGLVSLKVLSAQPGTVSTATQNYFDATPPATLNDLLTNLQTEGAAVAKSPLSSLVTSLAPAKAVELLTVLGQTLTPKATTAHLGRGLDLQVTAHTLSGATGAELDLKVQSTENGAGVIQAGSDKSTDDLNSRVSQHSVDTHVRVDSINLFRLSTLNSTLARGQTPWKPFDPIEVPILSLLVKVPRSPKIVYTQSLVFVDAVVVPTAADLGFGVPFQSDECDVSTCKSSATAGFTKLRSLDEFPGGSGYRLLQYNQKVVDCLNREYIGAADHHVHVPGNGQDNHPCAPKDYEFDSVSAYDEVQ